jgi:hypothetical protein
MSGTASGSQQPTGREPCHQRHGDNKCNFQYTAV